MQEKRQERKDEREKDLQQRGISKEEASRLKATIINPYLDDNWSEFSENLSTTNLYISFLPVDTTMDDLYETFGSFGPLASARILYPRPGESRPYIFAFVAYMSRRDAERAQMAMNGAEINGSDIKVCWGKVVEIPEVPYYIPPVLQELALPDPQTGLPFNAKPRKQDLDSFLSRYGALPNFKLPLPTDPPQLLEDYKKMLRNSVVRIVIPTERTLLRLIHRTIEYLVREGPLFEAAIMSREVTNPMFRFLFEHTQPTHAYYRWKLFSVLQGDDPYNWRLERFRLFDEGSWWEPPPHNLQNEMPPTLYHTAYVPLKRERNEFSRKRSQHHDEESREYESQKSKKRRGALSESDRDFLEQLLRNLTPKRRHVAFAMCWCLRRARSAKEIIDCVVEALMIPETPLFKKLGRFYLLSDILANCEISGPDIANFRVHIEPKLESIFVEFNKIFKRIPTRINQSQFRSRIAACIQLWSENTIYTKQSLIHYQNVFFGFSKEFEKSKNGSSPEDNDGEEEPSKALSERSQSSNSNEYIERSPPKNKNNALNFKAQDEWITVDSREQQPAPVFNKWEVDEYDHRRTDSWRPEHRVQQQPQKSNFKFAIQLGEIGRSEVVKASGKSSDEKRKILREIEEKVVLFQDELEEANDPFMDEKVEQYREELLQKAELTSFAESEVTNGTKVVSAVPRQTSSSYESRGRERERYRGRSKSRERSRSRDRERSHERDFRRSRSRERDYNSGYRNGRGSSRY
jgi:U2-associated protein SR140